MMMPRRNRPPIVFAVLPSIALLLGAACVPPPGAGPPAGRAGSGGAATGGAGGMATPGGAGGSGGAAGGGAGGGAGGAPVAADGAAGQGGSGGSPVDAAGAGGGGGSGGARLDASGGAAPDARAPVDITGTDLGAIDPGAGAPTACPELTAGWTPYTSNKTIQRQGGESFCEYRESGGVEFFRMTKNPAGVIQRCEARVANDYNAGRNQFEGDVRVTMGEATCVHQIFKSFMLDAFPTEGGQLRHYSGETMVSGVFGKWVHVNTTHDVATNRIDLYIDCVKKGSWNDRTAKGPNGFYFKYGLYGILGEPPRGQVSQVEWRNVRYYRR